MGSISAWIPSNYVLRVSKTSVAAGTFAGHELFVAKKVSPTLGGNYIDINYRPLRATFVSYNVVIFHQTSSGADDHPTSLVIVLLTSLMTNCCGSLLMNSFGNQGTDCYYTFEIVLS